MAQEGNIRKDPMELEEGFFDQQDMATEDEFKNNFTSMFTQDPPAAAQEIPAGSPPGVNLDEEGNPITEGQGEEDLDFDASLEAAEKEEIEKFNKILNTDFKSINELKEHFKKEEPGNTQEIEFERDQKTLDYHNKVLNYNDEDIIRHDIYMDMLDHPEMKNWDQETMINHINSQVESMKEVGQLRYNAKNVRYSIEAKRDKLNAKVQEHERVKNMSIQERENERKSKIQEKVSEIYKEKKFLGITPSKADLLEAYNTVTQNKHLDKLKDRPDVAVEFELYLKHRDTILKNLGKPNFNAGVKSTLNKLGLSDSSQTGEYVQGKNTNQDDGDLTFSELFVK
jgi:hypothetical protein